MKVVQLHEQIPKQLSNPTPTPQTSPLGPKTDKNDPKIKSTKISEFRESQKTKVVQLQEWRPKQFLNIEPKNSQLGPQKVKNNHKIKLKSNVRIEGNKENKSICTI